MKLKKKYGLYKTRAKLGKGYSGSPILIDGEIIGMVYGHLGKYIQWTPMRDIDNELDLLEVYLSSH